MALYPPFAWLASGIAGGAFLTNQFKNSSSFLKKVDMPKIESTPRYIPFITTQENQDPILSEMKKIVIYGILGSVSIYLISAYFKKEDSFEKQILPQLIKSRSDAINLVKEVDNKNKNRIHAVEQNNRTRAVKLSNDIRSESRTNFDIVSSQIYGLTQISLKTLGAINDLSIKKHTGEDLRQTNKETSNFITRANEFNKVISCPNYWRQSHQYHIDKINEQYPLLTKNNNKTINDSEINITNYDKKIRKKKLLHSFTTYSVIGGVGLGVILCSYSTFRKKK